MSRNQAWALLREGRLDEAEALAGEGLRNASGTRGLLGWVLVLLEATCLRGEYDSLQRMGRLAQELGMALQAREFLCEAAEIFETRQPLIASGLLSRAALLRPPSEDLCETRPK